jgi:hypothetical protein
MDSSKGYFHLKIKNLKINPLQGLSIESCDALTLTLWTINIKVFTPLKTAGLDFRGINSF